MKIVINRTYGGFGLSREAFLKLREMGNERAIKEPDYAEFYDDGSGPRIDHGSRGSFCGDIDRNDPQLIEVVEKLGDDASGEYAELKIVEIPDGVDWIIEEYGGLEWISEKHRIWE